MAAGRPEPPELAEFLEPFEDGVVEIVRRLRERLLAEMPMAREFVWDATNAVSLAYTPTERWQDGICHIAVYTRHANLGFNDGAALADPLGLLVGTGARVRHVTIRSVDEAAAPWVADYVKAAMANAGMIAEMGDGGTTVRRSAGPKRRPHQRVR
jgi:hypothetical protein